MAELVVPIFATDVETIEAALEAAARAADAGADAIEWRVDPLAGCDAGPAAVEELIRRSPLPCILTCRAADEGGGFEGTEGERVGLLDQLALRGAIPARVDVEYARWIASTDLQSVTAEIRSAGAQIILSAHDFGGRPEKLDELRSRIDEAPESDITKIAWLAHGIEDAIICADLLATRTRPTIALCMGAPGLLTRVFTGAWGGLLTFAALDEASASAPGQPTLEEMCEVYRFAQISADTELLPLFSDEDARAENRKLAAAGADAVALALGELSTADADAAVQALRESSRIRLRDSSTGVQDQ